jgi:hypothetical protein
MMPDFFFATAPIYMRDLITILNYDIFLSKLGKAWPEDSGDCFCLRVVIYKEKTRVVTDV